MFKNHKLILGKIELSEKMFHEALITIANKTEELTVKKEFQKIVKSIKKED
jgi:dsDNA-specific endonuclease/ATPase MutS2